MQNFRNKKLRFLRLDKLYKKKKINIAYIIPNAITLLALCCGATSLKFGINGQWEYAMIAIFFAALFDFIDGAVARILNSTSEFGGHLDSFSDFLSFGVAPGFLIYLYSLKSLPVIGWAVSILYILSIVIRLARFNTDISLNIKKYDWEKMFFVGMPSPMSGALVILPMMLSFVGCDFLIKNNFVLSAFILIVSFLAVSRVPTFSLKKLKLRRKILPQAMLGLGLFVTLLIAYPWYVISIILTIYILLIPFGVWKYNQLSKITN
jgi:CDP-diacylglycerol--serine O-phosphatidyltransferase